MIYKGKVQSGSNRTWVLLVLCACKSWSPVLHCNPVT